MEKNIRNTCSVNLCVYNGNYLVNNNYLCEYHNDHYNFKREKQCVICSHNNITNSRLSCGHYMHPGCYNTCTICPICKFTVTLVTPSTHKIKLISMNTYHHVDYDKEFKRIISLMENIPLIRKLALPPLQKLETNNNFNNESFNCKPLCTN